MNEPLTDDQIDAFIEGKLWVLRKGTDTARTAARIIRKLYEQRRELRNEVAALRAKLGIEAEPAKKWTSSVKK